MYHLGVFLDLIDHYIQNPEEIGLILSLIGLCTVAKGLHKATAYMKITFTTVVFLVVGYYILSLIYIGYMPDLLD